ncbi:MAG: WD40 repeat domain-containing protein, partial [Alphaproteobacteria bacterium]|nr:WD40 repeat domain-containing protein [Alphaproteobacteria bacterium]
MSTDKEKDRRSGRLLFWAQIVGVAVVSVGIVLISWLNPDWTPWSARQEAKPETSRNVPRAPKIDFGQITRETGPPRGDGGFLPFEEGPDIAFLPVTTPAQRRALLREAQHQVAAGDPVTAALLALEALPDEGDDDADRDNRIAAHRILHEAHFNRKEHSVLAGHFGFVRTAAFSPDGTRIVTASGDRRVRLWRIDDGAMIADLKGHDGAVWSAAFSPDGRRLASASFDRTVRLWNVSDGDEEDVLTGHDDKVATVAFSPDGRRLVSASHDGTARIWDVERGGSVIRLTGHTGKVLSAVYSPDGRFVLTASEDATARLWNAASGDAIAVLRGHERAVVTARFSADGRQVVTASADHTAHLWDGVTGEPGPVLRGHT